MMRRLLETEGRWLRALLVLSTVTVAIVLAGLVGNLAIYFSDILLILVMAWVFAFVLSPVVSLINRVAPLPRTIIVVLVYALLFVGLSAVVLLIAAQLAESMAGFIEDLPTLEDRLPELLAPLQSQLDALGFGVDLTVAAREALQNLSQVSSDFLGPVRDIALASLSAIGNLLFIVFLSLFIVIDKDRILSFINRITPPRFADEVRLFQTSVAASFGGFIRGQAIQGIIYGAIAVTGSLALGIPYAPLTTALVAILQMIPFFGPFFSWAPPIVAAVLTMPEQTGTIIAISVIQAIGWFIVMNIVQPRVMASTVGIHPVVVLLSVLIGLKLQGVVGAIFAIPVAAVISAFFFHYLNRTQGGPRDVTSRAARRVEERVGRRVRVPQPPPVAPAPGTEPAASGGVAGIGRPEAAP
jgi:predicted PurR-regulated permease PerM